MKNFPQSCTMYLVLKDEFVSSNIVIGSKASLDILKSTSQAGQRWINTLFQNLNLSKAAHCLDMALSARNVVDVMLLAALSIQLNPRDRKMADLEKAHDK